MKTPVFSLSLLASIGLAGVINAAQPTQTQPSAPDTTGRATDRAQASTDTKNPLVVRIDPARVLDSSGQPVGKVENIVLNPSGCAEAAIITGERGRMIPVPWQAVKLSGETRGQGEAPGSGLTFTVNANNERLMAAPSFARDDWPNVSSVSWMQPSVQYFRSDTALGGTTGSSSTAVGSGASSATSSSSVTGPGATLPPTGRPGLPDRPPVPPSIPEPVNPGPPTVVPPTTPPPGSIPPPVTPPPPATVIPDNFPKPVNPPSIP